MIASLALSAPLLLTRPAIAATATNRSDHPSVMQAEALAHMRAAPLGGRDSTTVSPQTAVVSRAATATGTYNNAGLSREVFGFAPYWAVSGGTLSDMRYDLVSTVAYFGLSVNASGGLNNDAGMSTFNSSAFAAMVNTAHASGDRVVLVATCFDDSTINSVVSNQAVGQAAINNLIAAAKSKGLDGVNIDFEGSTGPSYPNIQTNFTTWVAALSSQVHTAIAGSQVTVDAYAGSASWDGGFMRVDTLAPSVDALFIMAYDMNSTDTLPNSPLSGPYTYTDTTSVDQFVSKAGTPAKVILGVPYYGYKYSTTTTGFHASINYGASGCISTCSDPYSDIVSEFQCAPQLTMNWDTASSTPWASWWSPATSDPCGGNHNSWRELYYDNAQSLGLKYDLVNNRNIRGTGMWALGYDHGTSELWNELAQKFTGSDARWSPWFLQAAGIGSPAVGSNSDGRLEVAGLTADNTAWHMWQATPGGAWASALLGGTLASGPAIARNADGRLELAAVGADGAIWHQWQTAPSSGWSGWHSLGAGSIGPPSFGTNADGRLELFAAAADHSVLHAYQLPSGAGWSGWTSLGGSVLTVPAPGRNVDGRLEIFAEGVDGAAWHAWQTSANAGWSGWSSLGGGVTTSPSVGQNADGRLEVFAPGPDGQAWHDWQTAPGAGWFGWSAFGGSITTALAVTRTPSGRLFIFGTGADGRAWRQVQTTTNGGWGGWADMGGPGLVGLVAGTNADGSFELFGQDGNHSLWIAAQLSPST